MKTSAVAFALLTGLLPAAARTVYVNRNADGATHDGASWATAFVSVQSGINAAAPGDEVWVAASSPASDAYVGAITLATGVGVYGGFAGAETERSQRNPRANVTILDGANSGIVVVAPSAISMMAVLDGFTIRNGNASYGAGLNLAGRVTISNNVITGNRATDEGGGIRTASGTIAITNNVISGNSATSGGGVYFYGGVVTFANNLLAGNSATTGGGLYVGTRLTVAGCTVAGNTSTNGGGLTCSTGSTLTVVNSVIANNSSGIQRLQGTLDLRNNDVFDNTAYNFSGTPDPTGSNGNISVDPLFVDRPGGDFRLRAGSPCIDAGDDSVVTAGATDLDGKDRILGAHVDMGAYEYGSVGPPPFSIAEVTRAMSAIAGLSTATADDLARLDLELAAGLLDLRDAVRIVRKVAGLEPNP